MQTQQVFALQAVAVVPVKGSNSPVIFVEKPGLLFESQGISIKYSLSSHVVLARQMLQIKYRLLSNDAFISLRTDIEPGNGESYVTLAMQKTTMAEGDAKRYQYELNVLFNASRSGEMNLRVPDLIYSEGGKDRLRFQFAEQLIKVNALPPYLPPYTPMVPIKLTSTFSDSWSWFDPLTTGEIYYWTIRLQAAKADALSLPDIRQQLISQPGIQFLPAEIARNTEVTHDNVIENVTYTIPFILTKSTLGELPAISLQYFNPDTRRLSSTVYPMPGIVALNFYLKLLIIFLLVSLCFFMLWKVYPVASRIYHHCLNFYQARRLLNSAETPEQLRQAMNKMGLSWGWPPNLSLKQWGLNWQRDLGADADMTTSLGTLAYQLYGGGDGRDISQLEQNILENSYTKQWLLCCKAALQNPQESNA